MTKANRNGQVTLTIRPSRRAIGRQGGGLHLLVHAEPARPRARKQRRPVAMALVIDRSGAMGQPARPRARKQRRPVAMALVIDRSGSMGQPVAGGILGPAPQPLLGTPGRGSVDTGRADKLSYVKAATRRLLDLMQDGDAVSVVTFDDQVAVTKPLTVLDDRSRRAIAGAVDRLAAGGSTFLEGGLRAGLEQFGEATLGHYGCKLVLLSDGRANVGEQRPAVLSEVAAEAAHRGITTSTLGVGNDYHIALMTSLAEAGNGDFSHIGSLDALDEILREEFTAAAEVTARDVRVSVELPERLAFGTNLNGFRQESTEHGFEVLLGDLVRPKEFLFEVTTPVPLEGDGLTIGVRAGYRDAEDAPHESTTVLTIPVCGPDEAEQAPVDEDVIARLLAQLPARAEMDATLAHEAGDLTRARSVVDASHRAMADMRRYYGASVAGLPGLGAWEARLSDLNAATLSGPMPSAQLKTMYAAGYDLSRSRPNRIM